MFLILGLREPAKTAAAAEKITWTLAPFGKDFRIWLAALVIFTLGTPATPSLGPRGEIGLATKLFGWDISGTVMLPILWSVFHVFKSGGNMIAGRLVDRFGPADAPGRLGPLCGDLSGFALASAQWHIWLLFMGYAMFYACTEPAEKTLVANLVRPEQRGLAYGWFNAAVGIGTLPASLLFGVLYQAFGALTAFGVGAMLALLAGIVLLAVRGVRQ